MKTIKGFLKSLRGNPIYEGFENREDLFSNFAKDDDKDIEILYAFYDYECYEGSATVIYYRKSTKKYYEVYGSDCFCYGLEDQWDIDEEIVPKELLKRLGNLEKIFEIYKNS